MRVSFLVIFSISSIEDISQGWLQTIPNLKCRRRVNDKLKFTLKN